MGDDAAVIDPHVHLQLADGMQLGRAPHGVKEYLQAIEDTPIRISGALVMAPREDHARTRALNDLVLDLATHDDRFFAMCSVHPADGDWALDELDRVASSGATGVKLHPNTQDFDVAAEEVSRVVAHAGRLGLPLLFDSYSPFDPGQPGKFVKLALDNPDAQLVLAHMHFVDFSRCLVYEVLGRYPEYKRNVWFELSATGSMFADSPYRDQLAWVCRMVGTDRVIWGSDYPLDDPGNSLAALEAYDFDRSQYRQIVHDNAASLYAPCTVDK